MGELQSGVLTVGAVDGEVLQMARAALSAIEAQNERRSGPMARVDPAILLNAALEKEQAPYRIVVIADMVVLVKVVLG